jgi:hypothetical protein
MAAGAAERRHDIAWLLEVIEAATHVPLPDGLFEEERDFKLRL